MNSNYITAGSWKKDITSANVEVTNESSTSARIVVGPIEKNHGHTFANVLRRVLLSSVPGSAIHGFTIEGASSAFSTVSGIYEDILTISLNLKRICVCLSGVDELKIPVEVQGPCVLKAGMIDAPNAVFVDKEQVIFTVTSDKSVQMDLYINKGCGYIANAESSHDIDNFIPIDAFYNPVRNVSYSVEDCRSDSNKDSDRIVLNIETNGVIDPLTTLNIAASFICSSMSVFTQNSQFGTHDKNSLRGEELFNPILCNSTAYLELSSRSANCLKCIDDIKYLGDLVSYTQKGLIEYPSLGKRSLDEIEDALSQLGLHLGMSVPEWPAMRKKLEGEDNYET